MKKVLAMLILGASLALPAAAFAAQQDTDGRAAQAVYQTEPSNLGTIAGPRQNEPSWIFQPDHEGSNN